MKFQLFLADIEIKVTPANCWPTGMSLNAIAKEHSSSGSRDQGIYLDFGSGSGENEEKPSSSDGVGQINKSYGKMATCLVNLR